MHDLHTTAIAIQCAVCAPEAQRVLTRLIKFLLLQRVETVQDPWQEVKGSWQEVKGSWQEVQHHVRTLHNALQQPQGHADSPARFALTAALC